MLRIPDKYRFGFIYLALTLATLTVFCQVRNFQFTNYDDDKYLSENPHISTGLKWDNVVWVFTSQHVGNWHPLTGLSHILDCQLFGLNSGRHHIVNLLFHIANTLLLFTILRRMTECSGKAPLSRLCSRFILCTWSPLPGFQNARTF